MGSAVILLFQAEQRDRNPTGRRARWGAGNSCFKVRELSQRQQQRRCDKATVRILVVPGSANTSWSTENVLSWRLQRRAMPCTWSTLHRISGWLQPKHRAEPLRWSRCAGGAARGARHGRWQRDGCAAAPPRPSPPAQSLGSACAPPGEGRCRLPAPRCADATFTAVVPV